MPNFASITIVGHLGKDVEVKFLADGKPVGRFNLAVGTGYGERKVTSWYRCSWWGDRVQKIQQYLTKGKAIIVHGEPSIRDWTDQEGRKHTSVEVRVLDVVLLGDGKANGSQQPAEDTAKIAEEAIAESHPDQNEIPF